MCTQLLPATCGPNGHGSVGWLLQDLSVFYLRSASSQQPAGYRAIIPAGYRAVIVGLPNLLPPNPPKKKAKGNRKKRDILCAHASAGSEGVEPPNQLHSVKIRFEFPVVGWGDCAVRELSAVTRMKELNSKISGQPQQPRAPATVTVHSPRSGCIQVVGGAGQP